MFAAPVEPSAEPESDHIPLLDDAIDHQAELEKKPTWRGWIHAGLFPLAIAGKAKQHGAAVAHVGANPSSSMREHADVFVRVPVQTKLGLPGEIPSAHPMTSLF